MAEGVLRLAPGRVVLLDRRVLRVTGRPEVRLTQLEVGLLVHLARRSPVVVSREELLREVWGASPDLRTRAVDHAIYRLREKLEPDPRAPTLLQKAYGEGYRLVPLVDVGTTQVAELLRRSDREEDLRTRLEYLDRALVAVGPAETIATSIRARRAEVRATLGMLEDARDDLAATGGAADAELAAAAVSRWDKRYDEAERALARVLARSDADAEERVRARHRLGAVAMDRGRWREARRCFERALEEADGEMRVVSMTGLGAALGELASFEAGRAWFERALEAADERGDRRRRMIAEANRAVLEHAAGEVEAALALARAALVTARGIRDRRYEAYASSELSQLLHESGELDDACMHAEWAVTGFREVGDDGFVAIALGRRGALACSLDAPEEGRRDLERAMELARREARAWILDGLRVLATVFGEPPPSAPHPSSFERISRRVAAR